MRKNTMSMTYTDGIHRTHVNTEFEAKKEPMFYITGYNPLPVKGKFYSSFFVLDKWLRDAGYAPIPCTRTNTIFIQA